MRVLIAGGGIGGLTLALSLHQVGIDALLCEAARDPAPLGIGILLQPAAVREFEALGLGPDLARLGAELDTQIYLTPRGQELLRSPLGRRAGYIWPALALHRGKLQMLLLQQARLRLGPEKIRTGLRLAEWRSGAEGVDALFVGRDGGRSERIPGAILVGADGVNSVVRARLFPNEGPPNWSGRMIWRGLAPAPAWEDGRSALTMGDAERRVRLHPIGPTGEDGLRPTNWVVELPWSGPPPEERPGWTAEGLAAEIAAQLEDMNAPGLDLPRLLAETELVYRTPRIDRNPLPCWRLGGVTLMGDAAHPSHPVGASAATQAVLDARALARALRDHGPLEGLREYEARRRADSTRVLLANRFDGPERLLDVAALRAPNGFARLSEIAAPGELKDMSEGYLRLAGLDVATVNREGPMIPGPDASGASASR